MANEQNLRPGEYQLTHEEQKKGGIASGEARRKKRDIRLALEMLLEKEYKAGNGQTISGAEAIAAKQMEKALKGDTRAFEVVRDTVGQKPAEKVEAKQTIVDLSKFSIDELKGMLDTEL